MAKSGKVFLLTVVVICILSSCNSTSSGLSKESEEAIVRKEVTDLAHFDSWKQAYSHFIYAELYPMLSDFKNAALHRWDFGDYSASTADQAMMNCRENAIEEVRTLPNSTFEKTYVQYMEKYYIPTKYHYVSDDELFLADIYYAVYEHSEPSACEIAKYLAGLFKINTPVPVITYIQRLKNKEVGYYWEVRFDNGEKYRVRVVKMEDGSYGITTYSSFG